jgi:hypothetical protein
LDFKDGALATYNGYKLVTKEKVVVLMGYGKKYRYKNGVLL